MPYKDKEKQKKAQRERTRRYRAKQKEGVTSKGVTATSIANEVTARLNIANYGQPDCACLHCRANERNGGKHTINHGPYIPFAQLGANEVNRVSLPGDVDYTGVVGVGSVVAQLLL